MHDTTCQNGGAARPSRRHFVNNLAQGCFGLALTSLLQRDAIASSGEWTPPDGRPHFKPKAKNVIWLFLNGGLSHMESFDPKPMLTKYAGKTIAATPYKDTQDPEKLKLARKTVVNDANGNLRNTLYPLQVGFKKHGQLGVEISDWWPHVAKCADDLAFVRSMYTTDDNHGAQSQFHTGRHPLDGPFPTFGCWVHYGLGSLNENYPQYISMGTRSESQSIGKAHYLGPVHDAVPIMVDPKNPLAYGSPEMPRNPAVQQVGFDLVNRLDRLRAVQEPKDAALAAHIQAYELAFRMQRSIPEVMDFAKEPAETQKLYGLDQPATREFGGQLLAARRFVERGVRFVQVHHGGTSAAGAWDAHGALKNNHTANCAKVDQPIAALITDLKRRGLFDDTVVLLATEFGRTPGSQGADGRDHHIFGFSIVMAGAGIKRGIVHGATDEIGFHATEDRHYVTDVHATLMHLLGLDSRRLELPGRKRLDIDHGTPIHAILS
jgi:hypothetical protein